MKKGHDPQNCNKTVVSSMWHVMCSPGIPFGRKKRLRHDHRPQQDDSMSENQEHVCAILKQLRV